MKLREHLQLLSRFRWMILGCGLAFGILAGVVVVWTPSQYRISLSFTITQTAPQETADYQYDGYYAIQSAQLVGDTVASWLRTPVVVFNIYERAQSPAPSQSLSRLTARFRTTNAAPQQVLVTFADSSEETGRLLAEAIVDESFKGDEGRKNELKTAMTIALGITAKKLASGDKLELKIEPLPAPEEKGEDENDVLYRQRLDQANEMKTLSEEFARTTHQLASNAEKISELSELKLLDVELHRLAMRGEWKKRSRLQIFWLSHNRYPYDNIVRNTGFSYATVRRWIYRYRKEGLKSIIETLS